MKKAMQIFRNLYRSVRLLSVNKNATPYILPEVTFDDLYNIRKIVNNQIEISVTDCRLGYITQQELKDEINTLMVIFDSLK